MNRFVALISPRVYARKFRTWRDVNFSLAKFQWRLTQSPGADGVEGCNLLVIGYFCSNWFRK